MSREHAALARQWFEEVWNQRRVDAIARFLTPESVGHLETGDVIGVDQFRDQVHAEFLRAFPDLKITIEDTVTDGDNVVVRWYATGCHEGDSFGLKATCQTIGFRGITWIRFQDGRFVEGWDSWNVGGLLQRLRDGQGQTT